MKKLLLLFILAPMLAFAQYSNVRVITKFGNALDVPYVNTNTFPLSGNVGIGTITPGRVLSIYGGSWEYGSSGFNANLVFQSGADHEMEFLLNETGNTVGKFLKAGPGQYVDFGINAVYANNKGIRISSNDTALYNLYGIIYASQGSGSASLFGPIANDGISKLQSQSISTSAFRWTPASTSAYVLTVGTDGHTMTPQPTTPATSGAVTFVLGTGAGTGATCVVNGDNYGGSISIQTGTNPTVNATIVTVYYNNLASPFGNCYPVVVAGNSISAQYNTRWYGTAATGPGLTIVNSGTALPASQSFFFYYNTHPY